MDNSFKATLAVLLVSGLLIMAGEVPGVEALTWLGVGGMVGTWARCVWLLAHELLLEVRR